MTYSRGDDTMTLMASFILQLACSGNTGKGLDIVKKELLSLSNKSFLEMSALHDALLEVSIQHMTEFWPKK